MFQGLGGSSFRYARPAIAVLALLVVITVVALVARHRATQHRLPAAAFPGALNTIRAASALSADSIQTPKLKNDQTVAMTSWLKQQYGQLPLSFEVNAGQFDREVRYVTRGSGFRMAFRADGLMLTLPGAGKNTDGLTNADTKSLAAKPAPADRLKMTLADANPHAEVIAEEPLPGKVNYLLGPSAAQWRTNISTYGRLRYQEVYRGIDLVFYGNQRELEYDFVVAPGADLNAIALKFEGARGVRIDSQGELIICVANGEIRQPRPAIYQLLAGVRREVSGGYIERNGGVGFGVADYDHSQPLVIDPILVYSTFVGGSQGETATAIAVDGAGNAYLTGGTDSTDLSVTPGVFQPANNNNSRDAFVAKINAAGSAFVYVTYFGGSNYDQSAGIAVNTAGEAYIAGQTVSSDLPTTAGAIQATFNSNNDAFIAKLNSSGSALVYSTYLGGPSSASAVAVDSDGNAYVTGATGTGFPITAGVFQPQQADNGQVGDAFVTKISPAGALVYSSYLGGFAGEAGNGIAVDSAGSAYVIGDTSSSSFPIKNAFQGTFRGVNDAFVTKVNPTGSALVYSTFLGGSNNDFGKAISVDASGNAGVTGDTRSNNFPTASAVQPASGGSQDAFVARFDSAGGIIYSTYLGGSDDDFGSGVAAKSDGSLFVVGRTISLNFPTTADAYQKTDAMQGGFASQDAFVSRLDPFGAIVYSTYFGGSAGDLATGAAVDAIGNVYVAGVTSSSFGSQIFFPTTANAAQPFFGGSIDGFVAKFGEASDNPTPTPTPTPSPQPMGNGAIVFCSVQNQQADAHILLMNADGSNRTQLTSQIDFSPSWSKDGTRIAFVRLVQGSLEIFTMNADGTNQVRLTNNGFDDNHPSWSPDGTKIAFDSTRNGRSQVFAMNADGSGVRLVSFNFSYEAQPSWSPDGNTIAFVSSRGQQDAIYLTNLSGSSQKKVTLDNTPEDQPAWSPDGTKIAYKGSRQGVDGIYVINIDGSNQTRLTSNSEIQPAWSPDGSKILFVSSDRKIYSMNPDGSNRGQISQTAALDLAPSWQPIAAPIPNPIDNASNFVRQQYLDFLNREPDQGGWDYWTSQITQCGSNTVCINNQRIAVSAAFFIELEFQQTGSVVYRLYRAAYGSQEGAPTRAKITYAQFIADRALLVGGSGLPQSTIDLANNFVARAAFKTDYPDALTPAEFVNKLFDKAGLTGAANASLRQSEIDALTGNTKSRAQVLLDVIDVQEFKDREYKPSFVLMQYFGYLRRDPDQGGYDFWLNILNNHLSNDSSGYRAMVCAFITSGEYQLRFGNQITHSDHDCSN